MENIDIDILKSILRKHLDLPQQAAILKEINEVTAEEEKGDGEKGEKEETLKIPKKSVVIITALPSGIEPKMLEDMVGFITEIPEDLNTKVVPGKIREIKMAFNESKKGKKNPAESLGELFEAAPTKLFKEFTIQKKPKGPLEFVFAPNR
jgi:hypothetical protein